VSTDLGLAPHAAENGRRLVVVRHGRTAWNAEGRAQGHADVPLDHVGEEQAAAVAPYLASLEPQALWTSDLARAHRTCAHVERETGLVARVDRRLREFDVGLRQGLTMPELAQRHPEAYTAWERGEDLMHVTRAEDGDAVADRVRAALADALDALAPGRTGVVVTHGAALKAGLVALLGWPAAAARDLRGMDNCAWATVEELGSGGRLRLAGYNESVRPGHDAPARLPDEV